MVQQPISEFQLLMKAVGYVKTHWWLFVFEIAVIYGYALYQYQRTPPVFESRAAILIDSQRKSMYQTFFQARDFSGNSVSRKQNIVRLLTSEEVLERLRGVLTDQFNADGRPNHMRSLFRNSVAVPVSELKQYIAFNYDRSSDVYSLKCVGGNPDQVRDLCICFMNTMQAYYPEVGQRDVMMRRDFLSRQIGNLTRQVSEREQALGSLMQKNPEFMSYYQLEVEEHGPAKLRSELLSVQQELAANRSMKQLLLNVPQAKRGEQFTLSAPIEALTAKVAELQFQVKLTENSKNPDRDARLKTLGAELERASSQLARLNDEEVAAYMTNPLPSASVRDQVTKLELEYRVGMIRLRSAERQLAALTEWQKKYQTQRLEFERTRTEIEQRRRLLTYLYNREQSTELELAAGGAEIFRLEEPNRPTVRTSPRLSRHMMGSLSICLFVIGATIVVLVAFFPRLDTEAEVNRLNLPVIGKIPAFRRENGAADEIPSFALEYLKIMNYRILRETKEMKCPVIIVTSPHAREGKSTVTQMLALSAHSPQRKTLIIDGDMLTAKPSRFFGVHEDHTPGLHAILTQADPPPMSSLVVPTGYEGLFFMPRGERMEPSPLPDFLRPVQQTLERLRQEYDIIFIDTPPLFAANLSHQWVGLADLIVVIARLFVTRPKDISEGVQTCKVFSKAAVGVALNCVPITSIDRRVSHYYFSRRKTKPSRLAA